MLEDVIARLVLIEPSSSWDRLRDIETVLLDLWPGARIESGGHGTVFPLSVDQHESNPEMGLDDVRDFVVRGQVMEARREGRLPVEGSSPVAAVCLVAYPVPGPDGVADELSRIGSGLKRGFPGCEVEYSTVRHPGLPTLMGHGSQVMEFKVIQV